MGASGSTLTPTLLRLSQEPVDVQEEAFWEAFWPPQLLATSQIYREVTADYVRKVKSVAPRNLATLIRRAVLKLKAATRTGLSTREAQAQVTNVILLLIRVMPLVLEDASWNGFWATPTPRGVLVSMPPGSLEEPMAAGAPENRRQEALAQQRAQVEQLEADEDEAPLFVTLLKAILDLCFAPGYTVRIHQQPSLLTSAAKETAVPIGAVDTQGCIWYQGVGMAQRPVELALLEENRVNLLRLLLCCVSSPLYTKATELDPGNNRIMSYLTSGKHRNSRVFYLSLINSLCGYDPVGLGVPYNYWLVPGTTRELIAQHSGQLLALMLDFEPSKPEPDVTRRRTPNPASTPTGAAGPGSAAATGAADTAATSTPPAADAASTTNRLEVASSQAAAQRASPRPAQYNNALLNLLASLHEADDLNFVINGLSVLLNHPLRVYYMPASYKSINLHEELLVFLWRLCELNRAALSSMLQTGKVLELLSPVLHQIHRGRQENGRTGMVYVSVYLLMLWSGERNFAVRLNKEYADGETPMELGSSTYAEDVIAVLHNILVQREAKYSGLIHCAMTVLVNISPYVKSLGLRAANQLVHLFKVFSTRKFLFAAQDNYIVLYMLLECFTNIMQYQYAGNAGLAYAIIRHRLLFAAVQHMTFAEPTEDLAEAAQPWEGEEAEKAKEAAAAAAAAAAGGASATSTSSGPTTPADGNGANEQAADGETAAAGGPDNAGPAGKAQTVEAVAADGPIADKARAAKSAFEPTEEWFNYWKAYLPMETVNRLLKILVPQVERFCTEKGVTHEEEVQEFLQRGQLTGLLPVPPPIVTRRYQASNRCTVWFHSFVWAFIFVKTMKPEPPLFFDTAVQLFIVEVQQ